jgi:uncharacterized protein (DUF1810 family)
MYGHAPMADLEPFRVAQDERHSGFDAALFEIRTGRKRGHWIWYVFPQLAGLGVSATSRAYAIRDVAEAQAYLRDPILCARLISIAAAVAEQVSQGRRLEVLMGSALDAQKLVSSLTLFGPVARDLCAVEGLETSGSLADSAERVLREAERQGIPRCSFTLAALKKSGA